MKKHPVFDAGKCASCKICMQACPVSAISMTDIAKHGKYVNVFPVVAEQTCIGCSQCAAACPMNCIEMKEV